MLLIQGEADVAILSACVLEQLSNEGLIEASDFKVLVVQSINTLSIK